MAATAGAAAAFTATRVHTMAEADGVRPELLPPESLNQPKGVPQSLRSWQHVRIGESHWVSSSTPPVTPLPTVQPLSNQQIITP